MKWSDVFITFTGHLFSVKQKEQDENIGISTKLQEIAIKFNPKYVIGYYQSADDEDIEVYGVENAPLNCTSVDFTSGDSAKLLCTIDEFESRINAFIEERDK